MIQQGKRFLRESEVQFLELADISLSLSSTTTQNMADDRGGGVDDDLTLPRATVQKLIGGVYSVTPYIAICHMRSRAARATLRSQHQPTDFYTAKV